MLSENSIEVKNVWKSFQSGAIQGRTLMQQIGFMFSRITGKQDPNAEIISREEVDSESTSKNRRFWALKDVSFNVKKGEVLAVLGRNGAGKSTLLQIISRITEADRGSVELRGKIASLLGAGVGFNDEMTGRENVFLSGSILGMQENEISECMNSIAEFAEIPEFLDTPVKRYSNGMRARLAFSVAIHLKADIMVLDEVFATGDRLFRNKCIERMKELALSGKTILIVTHLPSLLSGICERGVVLQNGGVVFDGDIDTAVNIYLGNEPLGVQYESSRSSLNIKSFRFVVENSNNRDEENGMIDLAKEIVVKVDYSLRSEYEKLVLVIMFFDRGKGVLGRFRSPAGSPVSVESAQEMHAELRIKNFPVILSDAQIGVRVMLMEPGEEKNSAIKEETEFYPVLRHKCSNTGIIACVSSWDFKHEK